MDQDKGRPIWVWLLLAMIALGLALGGYHWLSQRKPGKPKRYAGPVAQMRLATCEENSALIQIAEEKGYFSDSGVDATVKDYQAGKIAADAFLAGEADICASSDFVFVSNSFHRPDLRVLGLINSIKNLELIARRDRGIAQPSDLKGKRIGVTRKSVGEFFLGTFLTVSRLSITDIEIIDLKPRDMAGAISMGEVDAVLTWEPNTFDIKDALKDEAISWPGQSGQPFYFMLISTEAFVKENADALVRLFEALTRAEEFVTQNDDQAKAIIAAKFGYTASYVDTIWPNHRFVLQFPQDLLILMEDEARWRIENKLTDRTEVPNYLDYIYTDAFDAVRPGAVTIVR